MSELTDSEIDQVVGRIRNAASGLVPFRTVCVDMIRQIDEVCAAVGIDAAPAPAPQAAKRVTRVKPAAKAQYGRSVTDLTFDHIQQSRGTATARTTRDYVLAQRPETSPASVATAISVAVKEKRVKKSGTSGKYQYKAA